MRTSPTDKLLQLAAKRQIVRTKDASELGVPRNYLGRLVRKGIVEKVRRGLYTSPEFSGNEHLTQVMKRLGGMWFLAASLLSLVPRALRDLGYVTCAFLRKAILGTTQEVSPLVPTQWRERFRD